MDSISGVMALKRAKANAAKLGVTQVEFRLGGIEHLPLADGVAAGAAPVAAIEDWLAGAGFADITIRIAPQSRDAVHREAVRDYGASALITAVKPR